MWCRPATANVLSLSNTALLSSKHTLNCWSWYGINKRPTLRQRGLHMPACNSLKTLLDISTIVEISYLRFSHPLQDHVSVYGHRVSCQGFEKAVVGAGPYCNISLQLVLHFPHFVRYPHGIRWQVTVYLPPVLFQFASQSRDA